MQFHIDHDGQQHGPLTLEEVRARLAAGAIAPADLAWHPGALEWQPLSTIPGVIVSMPPPLAGHVPAAAVPNTSGLAITSMVLGILSFLTVGLTAIPAVICGHLSRASIRKSAGTLAGDGFALAGLILGYVGFAIMGVGVLAGLAVPVIMNTQIKAARSEAIGNAKQVGIALFDFEQDYNMYPCDASAAEVRKNKPNANLPAGKTSSNDYFRQLFAADLLDTEKVFYARIPGCRKPDNNMAGSHLLEKGECGFSYIIGASSTADPPQPLLVTPLIPGTDRFDPKPFGKKAVVFWSDSTCTTPPIDRTGHVMHLGMNLLNPANPVWQGKAPRVVWPE